MRSDKIDLNVSGNVYVTHKMTDPSSGSILAKLDQIIATLASGGLSEAQVEQIKRITAKIEAIDTKENQ